MTSIITATSVRSKRSRQDRACVARRPWNWWRNRTKREENEKRHDETLARTRQSFVYDWERTRRARRLFVPFADVNHFKGNVGLFRARLRRHLDLNAFVFRSRLVAFWNFARVR